MAVIRQRQQVFSKPIGVTRMDTGEAELWKTVKAGADQLTSIAFREGQTIAEETGREAALDLDISKINGVNPETGMSEPLSAPQGFGSIARRAYEKVVDARFMDDAQDRLKLKAKELGSKYSRNPEEFSKQMSSFIAETADKTAEGKYRSTIIESGQKFLSDMQINLIDQQRSRARARETDFANYRAFQYGERIGEIAASGDFEGASKEYLEGLSKARGIETAGMNGRKETEIHRQNYSTSLANGAVEHILTGLNNDVSRRSFLLYLETKGKQGKLIGYAKERKADIDKYLIGKESFLDANNMRDVIAYGTGLGNAATQLDNAKIAQSQAQSDLYWKSRTKELDLRTSDIIDSMGGQVSATLFQSIISAELDPMLPEAQGYNAIQGVARLTNEKLSQEVARAEQRRLEDPNYTNPEKLADVKNLRQRALDSFVLLGISEGNSDKFFNALKTGEHLGISETQIAVVEAIRTNPNLFNRLEDVKHVKEFISNNKDTSTEQMQDRALAWEAGSLGKRAIEIAAKMGFPEARIALKNRGKELGIVEGAVSYPVYQAQLDEFDTAWAKVTVDRAMSLNISSEELDQLELFVRDGVMPDNATDLVRNVAAQIKEITGESLNTAPITGHIESINRDLKQVEAAAERAREVSLNVSRGFQGNTPEQSAKTSEEVDRQIAGTYLGIAPSNTPASNRNVSNLIRLNLLQADSLSVTSLPDGQRADVAQNNNASMTGYSVYEHAKRGVISGTMVQLFKDVVEGKTLSNAEIGVVMNHYANLTRSTSSEDGRDLDFLIQFEDEIGKNTLDILEAIHLTTQVVGTRDSNKDLNAPKILQKLLIADSPDFKDTFKNGNAFISEHLPVDEFSGEAKDAMTNVAKYLFKLNDGVIDPTVSQLKKYYENKFKETKGYVLDSAQAKPNRSLFALDQTLPNDRVQSAFIGHVQAELSKLKPHPLTKKKYTFGSNSSGVAFTVFDKDIPYFTRDSSFTAGEVFLHPLPKSNDRAVYYMAMEMGKNNEMIPKKTDPVEDSKGNVITPPKLMIFSTNEPYLQEVRESIDQEVRAEAKNLLALEIEKYEKIAQDAIESGVLSNDNDLSSFGSLGITSTNGVSQ